ncbi:hypothetical protein PSI9734_00247 [Pseudidiomarina piscicola]|uniref:Uncharacterized protein n=1 Tax=Pseudidiomarina piscicola TaxID=2614830 RepID=A0A6S6WL37_9GAMM|nr:hypothetical protein [Pseudidiomarina piscicola]CAB0149672.1 hypothetical protein PSI9734_00247 [Pseudidiomarina piscicola]VZT39121.1 hypothetical protein PSI9734_00247 [Pseudomonas aeruginosa]
MANDQDFRDPSGALMGWLAVLVVVAVPLLPATVKWFQLLSA